MCFIGISIGLTAVLMRQCLDGLDKVKWDRTKYYIEVGLCMLSMTAKFTDFMDFLILSILNSIYSSKESRFGAAFAWTAGISVLYVIFGSSLVAVSTRV